MPKSIIVLAWAWIIIVGGLMITPGGISCIRCGPTLNLFIAILSIVLGLAGLVGTLKGQAATH
jgi:hypothetical protein